MREKWTYLPVEDIIEEFFLWDVASGDGKTRLADFVSDFLAQFGRQADEPAGGDGVVGAFGQFVLDALKMFREVFPAFLAVGEAFFRQGLRFDGAEILDFELIGAAPLNESGFRDVDLGGNAGEAPAGGTELNEASNRFLIFHKNLS